MTAYKEKEKKSKKEDEQMDIGEQDNGDRHSQKLHTKWTRCPQRGSVKPASNSMADQYCY